jgi:hypothetical protein
LPGLIEVETRILAFDHAAVSTSIGGIDGSGICFGTLLPVVAAEIHI